MTKVVDRDAMRIRLDFNNMMAEYIGKEGIEPSQNGQLALKLLHTEHQDRAQLGQGLDHHHARHNGMSWEMAVEQFLLPGHVFAPRNVQIFKIRIIRLIHH